MALRDTYPLYVANVPEQPNADLVVTDKFTGKPATRVAMADAATIDRGIAAAVAAAEPMARMASFERQAVLAQLQAELRSICDPEEVDRRAKADQADIVERNGGREAVIRRGTFGATPPPGTDANVRFV